MIPAITACRTIHACDEVSIQRRRGIGLGGPTGRLDGLPGGRIGGRPGGLLPGGRIPGR